MGAKDMFREKYAQFALVAPKQGFDVALQISVDVITPANAGTHTRRKDGASRWMAVVSHLFLWVYGVVQRRTSRALRC